MLKDFLLNGRGDVVRPTEKIKTLWKCISWKNGVKNRAGGEESGWNDPVGHQAILAAFAVQCDLKQRLRQLLPLVS